MRARSHAFTNTLEPRACIHMCARVHVVSCCVCVCCCCCLLFFSGRHEGSKTSVLKKKLVRLRLHQRTKVDLEGPSILNLRCARVCGVCMSCVCVCVSVNIKGPSQAEGPQGAFSF